MQNVMHKAQELAEAILESDIYKRMHETETALTKDEDATRIVSSFMEKRNAVQDILASNDLDHEQLAQAGKEMEEAEKAMNECEVVIAFQNARRDFSQMMESVNKILRLVITGEVEEEGCGGGCGSCGGDCGSCGGCH